MSYGVTAGAARDAGGKKNWNVTTSSPARRAVWIPHPTPGFYVPPAMTIFMGV